MIVEDIHGEEIYPGDIIVKDGWRLIIGKVSHVSYKGTIYYRIWDCSHKTFTAEVFRTRSHNIVKLTPELGVQIR